MSIHDNDIPEDQIEALRKEIDETSALRSLTYNAFEKATIEEKTSTVQWYSNYLKQCSAMHEGFRAYAVELLIQYYCELHGIKKEEIEERLIRESYADITDFDGEFRVQDIVDYVLFHGIFESYLTIDEISKNVDLIAENIHFGQTA